MPRNDIHPDGRLFIAFPVSPPPDYARLLPRTRGAWQVHPSDLHMTVAFLGTLPIEKGIAALESLLLGEVAPFEVSLMHPHFLGNPPPGSALTLTPEAGKEKCHQMIREWRPHLLRRAGLSDDPRAVLPHVTVLRMHRPTEVATKQRIEAEFREAITGQDWRFKVRSVALYGGRQDPRESRYVKILERKWG